MYCSGFNNTAVACLRLRSPITKSRNRDRGFLVFPHIAKKIGIRDRAFVSPSEFKT
jgi:hypothetical protein